MTPAGLRPTPGNTRYPTVRKDKEIPMRAVAALILAVLLGAAPFARAATVTFDVDDTGEAGDTSTGDGVCHTASNTCTLLAALQQASAPSADTFVINLGAGTYTVSATLPAITRSVSIQGTGAATRIIRSSNAGRPLLFNVTTGGNLTLDHVTISNAGHGAISILDGSASITNSVVTGNAQGAVYINTSGATPSSRSRRSSARRRIRQGPRRRQGK